MILRQILMSLLIMMFFTGNAEARTIRTFQPLQIAPLELPSEEEPFINENYPKITQLEINMFKRTYERENIYKRLSRIEQKIFNQEFKNMPLASRVDNILSNIDAGIMHNISERELARTETKVLGRTYPNDDTESRITRLEKEMLGAMQGGNLPERFNTVKTASRHYNSYPELAQSQGIYQTYSGPYTNHSTGYSTKHGLSGFIQNVMGMIFGGMNTGIMTGCTPPIYDPYNPYAQTMPYSPMGGYSPFMNQGVGQQDYFMGNRGGYINNRNIGSQSSVRILD